jgi:hypothetical protein
MKLLDDEMKLQSKRINQNKTKLLCKRTKLFGDKMKLKSKEMKQQ